MKRVRSIIFSSFKIDSSESSKSTESTHKIFKDQPYSETSGFGFSRVQSVGKKLEAVLLKRNNTYVQEYDSEHEELIKRQIIVFSTLKFEIDAEIQLLTVYGGNSQLNTLRGVFRNLPQLIFSSDPVELMPENFCKKLKGSGIGFKIQQLTIKNFNYQDGMIGRFSGEISNQEIASDLLQEYASSVVKTTFQITIDEEIVLIQLLPNGSIKLLCEEDEFEYYLNFLKQLIFNG